METVVPFQTDSISRGKNVISCSGSSQGNLAAEGDLKVNSTTLKILRTSSSAPTPGYIWCWLNNMILKGRILMKMRYAWQICSIYSALTFCLLLLTARTVSSLSRPAWCHRPVTDQYLREALHMKVSVDGFNFIFGKQAAERCTWSCLLILATAKLHLLNDAVWLRKLNCEYLCQKQKRRQKDGSVWV